VIEIPVGIKNESGNKSILSGILSLSVSLSCGFKPSKYSSRLSILLK
jgi:hypothetical protein